MNIDSISFFGLTNEQTAILFSLQRYIVMQDIELTKKEGGNGLIWKDQDEEKRQSWLNAWEKNIENYLRGINKDGSSVARLILSYSEISDAVKNMQSNMLNSIPFYFILLEVVLFTPYYAIPEESNEKQKEWLALKFDNDRLEGHYKEVARTLGISDLYPDKFLDAYKSAINGITGFWTKMIIGTLVGVGLMALTAGMAAAWLAPLFAAKGLAGAAAVSAGLAALGGGAVAAGGMGMAGGFAVLVGGGALLGGVVGATGGMLFAMSPEVTLSQAAKLEVVIKEIVLSLQKDTILFQEILLGQQNTISQLEQELLKQKLQNKLTKEQIKNMEKSIEYLKKSIERNREAAA